MTETIQQVFGTSTLGGKPDALVTGATGIVGRAVVDQLVKSGKWGNIHIFSRSRRNPDYPSNVFYHSLDMIDTAPKDIADQLRNEQAKGQYIFFSAYRESESDEALCEENGKMLRNFVEGVATAYPGILKKVILTTGAKHYGVHWGPIRLPAQEDDPRIEFTPNFYYVQEDILAELAGKHKFEWVVARPNDIVGFAKGNFMNLASTIAIYAAITKELGEKLLFPGNKRFYFGWDDTSYSPLIAEFEEWAATESSVSGECFNIANGDDHTWSRTWPKVAQYFGLELPQNMFAEENVSTVLHDPSPMSVHANELGATVEPGKLVHTRPLTKWAARPEVKKAWDAMAARENLDPEGFTHATWGFTDFVVGRNYDIKESMAKARKFGWSGYQDSTEGLLHTFDKMKENNIIPK